MMKKCILLIKILTFIILFAGCGKLLRFVLVDDSTSFTRIMMHEFYHQEQNIDILFVGSSHCYFSFVPAIADEILDKNTFCAGSSAQQLDASYELIKEASRLNDLEHIYLEVYCGLADYSPYKERTLMTSTYIISDYMRPSLSKTLFLLKASSKAHYANSFITARRNWENFLDPDYVMNLIQKKTSPAYRNYDYVSVESKQYAGKGYVTNEGYAPEYFYLSYYPMYTDGFSKDWENSLNEIIDYCIRKEIPLTLVSVPLPNYSLAAMEYYDTYIEKINQIIGDRDVDYYDYNLCREEYIPNSTTIFRDSDHLNTKGAEIFSTIFSRFCAEQITEEELFHDSYAEKLASLEPTVFGLSYRDYPPEDPDEIPVRHIMVVSSYASGMEYRIFMKPEDNTPYTVQDFSENKNFEISLEEHGICVLTARIKGETEADWRTIEIEY